MSVFTSADELNPILVGALRGFLGSTEGAAAAEAAKAVDAGPVIAVHVTDPDTQVWVDLKAGEADVGVPDDPAADLHIDGDSLHHLALNQLAPVQVCRAVEETRLDAAGSFELLLGLLTSLDALGDQWRQSLRACGREDLIEIPAPPETVTYSVDQHLARQGHEPPWAGHGKRAKSNPTRRLEERPVGG